MRIKEPNTLAYIIYAKKKNGKSYITIHYSDISKKQRIKVIQKCGYTYYWIYQISEDGSICFQKEEDLTK